VDAVGQRAALLGKEDGTLEAYVYPLKLFQDFKLTVEVGGREIPASSIARRVISSAGSVSIIYSGDEFQITQTLVVPPHLAGGVIVLDVQAYEPVTLHFDLQRDFQLMWPAAFGSGYGQWDADTKLYYFGADGQPYAAVLGSPGLQLDSRDYATNYSSQLRTGFSLPAIKGERKAVIGFAGSMKSREEAIATYKALIADPAALRKDTERYWNDYLSKTVSVELPDKDLEQAYDWSRLSLAKGMVDNPFLGKGLIAGYGPGKGSYRPGFAWFFGRDSFWSSFALNAAGDLADSRTAIEFISKFQRDDGKVPHEISQSASLVPWSQYPYEYASADATPLFIIAVRDYVERSGDTAFANAMWDRVNRAMKFSQSTLDAEGFQKNLGVGHGWVEGGPLLPVRVELYMAGCYVEALRSLAQIAQWTGHQAEADALKREFEEKQQKLNTVFWLQSSQSYALAIGTGGTPVDQPSVLAIVPNWWKLLTLDKAQLMTQRLAEEEHAADWGVRIISSKAALYSPAGYHFGSVWPLFTGWASLGEYNAHEAAQGWANLKANSWLSLDQAGGNTTEVISGETYSPLSTASPHQIWSAAMVISPLLKGLFGLEVDAIEKKISLQPHLPFDWTDTSLRHVPLANGSVDFVVHRDGTSTTLQIENHSGSEFLIDFAPAYESYSEVTSATFGSQPVKVVRREEGTDWHAAVQATIPGAGGTITLHHQRLFGISIPAPPPALAETSSNLKLISKVWDTSNKHLTLTLSGLANRTYPFLITGADSISSLSGAERMGNKATVTMPAGTGYQHATVIFDLK
jgi:glycogen debranching enzyme